MSLPLLRRLGLGVERVACTAVLFFTGVGEHWQPTSRVRGCRTGAAQKHQKTSHNLEVKRYTSVCG